MPNSSFPIEYTQFVDKFQEITSFELLNSIETKPLLFNFIVRGGINVIYARGGSGKSLLAEALSLNLMRDGYFVVYLDKDNPVDLPKARGFLDKISEYKLQKNFVYFNSISFEELAKKYQKEIKENGNTIRFIYNEMKNILGENIKNVVLVIDSLQNFVNTNDTPTTTYIMDELRNISNNGVTVLAIHHTDKATDSLKGLTIIRDRSDMVSKITIEKDEQNLVKSWIITEDKYRYTAPEKITIKNNNFDINIVDVAIDDKTEVYVLRTAISILRKEREQSINQSELVLKIQNQLNIGEKKIRYIIDDAIRKNILFANTGQKNAKLISVNESSEYLKVLFDFELSQDKKTLLSMIDRISDIDINIDIMQNDKSIRYINKNGLRRDVYKFSDEETIQALEALSKYLEENTADT